jgi:hypothetical protein
VALTGGLSASVAAGATTTPTAELSINPSKGALTVELAARSAGFGSSATAAQSQPRAAQRLTPIPSRAFTKCR